MDGERAVNSYTRAQVVASYNNSKTTTPIDEVGKRLNIFKTCVFNAIRQHKETDEFIDKNVLDCHKTLMNMTNDI